MRQNKGTIMNDSIYSASLNERIDLITYLPPAYSALYKYNILIAQDGQDYFNLGRIARVANKLHDSGQMNNTIIIGIPYKDVNDRRDQYHPNGIKHKAYLRFLAHELVPFLDEKYPTYQMGTTRALIGDSLGGTVSLLTALAYPHTFGKVMMQSPYVNEAVLQAVDKFSNPYLLDLYHVIGLKETNVATTNGKAKDLITPNRELYKLFRKRNFSIFYDEFDGDHTWTYWQKDLERALKKMLEH